MRLQLAQCDIKAKYMLTIYEVYLISLFQIPIRPGIRKTKNDNSGCAPSKSLFNYLFMYYYLFTQSYFEDLTSRGASRGDIFARHLAAHQRIWN